MIRDLSLVVIVIIIILAAINGIKNKDKLQPSTNGSFLGSDFVVVQDPNSTEDDQKKWELQDQIYNTQRQLDEVSKEIARQNDDKNLSKYRDKITFYGGYGSSANSEYIEIRAKETNKEVIKITGWTITSTTTNQTVVIPKSTLLYFANSINSEEDVYLRPGEVAYIITGKSPIGYGFKGNKCSGYLTQYNDFTPYLYSDCPHPKYEDLSSIPRTINNEICFDLIDSFGSCRVQTEPLSNKYSSECQDFIYKKITYPNCINVHKNDKDFWGKSWRIYLKRSERLWRDRRETIVLYDEFNKPVGKIIK